MNRSPNHLSLRETKEALGAVPAKALIDKGVLKPTKTWVKGAPLFEADDVAVLAELIGKTLDLPQAVGTAKLAEFRARRAERLVMQVLDMLGVNIPIIDIGYKALTALYYRAEDDLGREDNFEAIEIREWSKVFYGLGEEHLEALSLYFSEPEPYRVFMDLGARLKKMYLPASKRMVDALTLEYLQASVRCLRQTAYFYVGPKEGLAKARQVLGGCVPDINRELLDLMFTQIQP